MKKGRSLAGRRVGCFIFDRTSPRVCAVVGATSCAVFLCPSAPANAHPPHRPPPTASFPRHQPMRHNKLASATTHRQARPPRPWGSATMRAYTGQTAPEARPPRRRATRLPGTTTATRPHRRATTHSSRRARRLVRARSRRVYRRLTVVTVMGVTGRRAPRGGGRREGFLSEGRWQRGRGWRRRGRLGTDWCWTGRMVCVLPLVRILRKGGVDMQARHVVQEAGVRTSQT